SASAADRPLRLSTRPSVSDRPTLPWTPRGAPPPAPSSEPSGAWPPGSLRWIPVGALSLAPPAEPGAPGSLCWIPPGRPTGGGTDPDGPRSASGCDGTIAVGVARSAARLIAPTEVCLSHTKTYRLTTTRPASTSTTQPPVLRAGDLPRFPIGRTDLFLRAVLRLVTMAKEASNITGLRWDQGNGNLSYPTPRR